MAEPISGGAVAGIIIISITLVKVVDVIVSTLIKKLLPDKLSPEEHRDIENLKFWCRELYEAHDKFDTDGTPIWYVPRSWIETTVASQKEILTVITQVSNSQEKVSTTLERMVKIIERIERRQVPHENQNA